MTLTLFDILVIYNHGFWNVDTLQTWLRSTQKKFTPSVKNSNRGKSFKGVPFVLTYHLKLKSLNKILTKYFYLLYMDKGVNKLFTPELMFLFHSVRTWSNYLLRAKTYLFERTIGSKNFNSKRFELRRESKPQPLILTRLAKWLSCVVSTVERCKVPIKANEASTFTSTVTEETFIINKKFDYNDRCLLFLSNLTPLPPFYSFAKNVSSKERVKSRFFVTFNIILKYIFPNNFIEFSQVVQKIWRNSLLILVNFHQFLSIFCIFWRYLV